jgi:undecaprenyl-diphosphatase
MAPPPARPGTDPPGRADARFGARAVLAAISLTLLAVPFALLLFLVQDGWPPLLRVDEGARDDLNAFARAHDPFVSAMKVLSTIGSAWVYGPVVAVLAAWLAARRRPRLAAFVAVTVAGSAVLNSLTKLAVDRARPVLEDPVASAGGLSFPSGHAQAAIVCWSVFGLLALPGLAGRRRAGAVALAVAMVLAIGFSRIALGVHFVSDVLAGYVLGAAWVAAMVAAFRVWRQERRDEEEAGGPGLSPGCPGGWRPPRSGSAGRPARSR